MRTNIRRALAVAGVLAGLMAGGTTAATSAAADSSCPLGFHCAFAQGVGGPRHNFFNSDNDFRNDYWYWSNGISHGDLYSSTLRVDNNIRSASNSSSGGYRSNYWYGYNYSNFLFCVNPGGRVEPGQLWGDGTAGNYVGQHDEAGSMSLQLGSSSGCFG